MITPEQERQVGEFWTWFQGRERDLAALDDPESTLWDEALDRLKKVDEGLWFEMSEPGVGNRDFILTVEGEPELFEFADFVASKAPPLNTWKIISLMPPMGFDFQITCGDVLLDATAMWFFPAGGALPVDLLIGVPGYDEEKDVAVGNGVQAVLETGLGERSATGDIGDVEIVALPDAPEKKGFLKLSELPAFIETRRAPA
jgi:hypothetical protein